MPYPDPLYPVSTDTLKTTVEGLILRAMDDWHAANDRMEAARDPRDRAAARVLRDACDRRLSLLRAHARAARGLR